MRGPTRRLTQIPVHDPFVVADAVSRTYYLYTAYDGRAEGALVGGGGGTPSAGTGILCWTSPDLSDWTLVGPVFRTPQDGWADPSVAPWAPEVHEHKGRYYLVVTLHDPSTTLPQARQLDTVFRMSDRATGLDHSPVRRGCVVAVSDSLLGPFELLTPLHTQTPPDVVALDGTLHVDEAGTTWLVYAHEWVQTIDGTMEAVPLSDDLRHATGRPIHLFRASEASWLTTREPSNTALPPYVTDGPFLRRLPGGALAMLWSSFRVEQDTREYVQTQAISRTGSLTGPWEQCGVLVGGNAGHGSLFETFDGHLMLILHRGMLTARVRAELFQLDESPDGLVVAADMSSPARHLRHLSEEARWLPANESS